MLELSLLFAGGPLNVDGAFGKLYDELGFNAVTFLFPLC